mmetsp:Transcript_46826/g.146799  ORF Transcript_46826/g.146799 Transcript_46826/m.146799 type:complete len:242 (+) Transcript_46826:385-1110(+)
MLLHALHPNLRRNHWVRQAPQQLDQGSSEGGGSQVVGEGSTSVHTLPDLQQLLWLPVLEEDVVVLQPALEDGSCQPPYLLGQRHHLARLAVNVYPRVADGIPVRDEFIEPSPVGRCQAPGGDADEERVSSLHLQHEGLLELLLDAAQHSCCLVPYPHLERDRPRLARHEKPVPRLDRQPPLGRVFFEEVEDKPVVDEHLPCIPQHGGLLLGAAVVNVVEVDGLNVELNVGCALVVHVIQRP